MVPLLFFLVFIFYGSLFVRHVSGFLSDGTLEQTSFAQNAVTRNDNSVSLVAVKLHASTIILDISKRSTARSTMLKSAGRLPYKNTHLLAMFAGRQADCQQVRALCSDLDVKCHQDYGVSLSAPRLSLQLADIAQKCSMVAAGSRHLAYNALVVNADPTHKQNSFGDIYKVDVSGNFFKCKSVCIGAQSEQIGSWLNTVGKNVTAEFESATEPSIESLLNISAQCISENYPARDLETGKVSVAVTMMCDVRGKGQTVLGPYEVPAEVLAQLSSSQHRNTGQSSSDEGTTDQHSNRADAIATGVDTPTGDTTYGLSLLQWWNSLFGKVGSSIPDANIVGNNTLDDGKTGEENKPVWRRHL